MEQNYPKLTSIPRLHLHRRFKMLRAAVFDAAIILAAYSLAFWGRSVSASIQYSESIPFTLFALFVVLFCLYLCGVYQRIWERTSGHGVSVIVNAVGAATLVIILADLTFAERPLPLSVVVLGNILALVGFVAVRYRSRLVDGMSWRWKAIWYHEFPTAVVRVLIVGAGNSGQALAWRMKHRSPNGEKYRIVGFVDDDPYKQDMYVEGCPILGGHTDIPKLAEKHNIDLIIVAIHNINGPEFREILSYCERTKVRIKVVPDIFAMMNAKKNVTWLRDVQPEDLIGRSTISRHHAIDMAPVSEKVVLITGAAGSIGSELSRQIVEYNPSRVILLDANESGLHDLYIEVVNNFPKEKIVQALVDITDEEMLAHIFATYKPEVVFHAAAYKHVPVLEQYPNQALRVNIGGTLNLVNLATEHDVQRFVLISTDKAVNPSNVMGASKRVCELILGAASFRKSNRTLFTSVRFGNVLGSRGSVVPTFNRQIENGGPVTITHPDMTRYFMSIPEAVNLVIHAACITRGTDIYLLKMGEVVRIVDLAERMIRLRGLRPYQDVPISFTGVRPGEKLHEELYTLAERACDTLHPNIIQLENPYHNLNEADFIEQVEALLEQGLERQTALQTLCEIAGNVPEENRLLPEGV